MSKKSSTIYRITWSVSFEEGVRMAHLQEVYDQFVRTTVDALMEDLNQFVRLQKEMYSSMSVNFSINPTDQSCRVSLPYGFSDFAAANL
jgi:hypothetical protein